VTVTRTTPLADLPEFMRIEEAAEIFDCSKGILYEMCRTGAIESVRVGRLLRIPRRAILSLKGEK